MSSVNFQSWDGKKLLSKRGKRGVDPTPFSLTSGAREEKEEVEGIIYLAALLFSRR